jgi:nitrogen fixation NifU-like protein
MSFDVRELYQEMIIDHNRNPRNYHTMTDATTSADGFNRLCGDQLTVYLKIENDVVIEASFTGLGCAISKASASLMTEALCGKTVAEAHELFQRFHTMLTTNDNDLVNLDKLVVLAGVRAYPARVKCATLAWHTMEAALKHDHTPVSTERDA